MLELYACVNGYEYNWKAKELLRKCQDSKLKVFDARNLKFLCFFSQEMFSLKIFITLNIFE